MVCAGTRVSFGRFCSTEKILDRPLSGRQLASAFIYVRHIKTGALIYGLQRNGSSQWPLTCRMGCALLGISG